MSEIINVHEEDLLIMNNEALEFFIDELARKSTILVTCKNGNQKEFKTKKDWDEFLKGALPITHKIRKDYRI